MRAIHLTVVFGITRILVLRFSFLKWSCHGYVC
jgi:hypothetical protein